MERPTEGGTYTRDDAALLLGVKPELLRAFEERALVRPRNGSRYSNDDLVALRYAIHLTQEKGMDWTTARILINFQRTIRARGRTSEEEEP